MFGSIGVPELIVAIVLAMSWLIPIAVVVWIVVTLSRIRTAQDSIRARLEAIEHSLTAGAK